MSSGTEPMDLHEENTILVVTCGGALVQTTCSPDERDTTSSLIDIHQSPRTQLKRSHRR